MDESKILDVKNLRISFRTINGTVKAVRGIDFTLHRGRTLAIVGESGSGKSVTSRAIMGILAPNKIVEEGEILYGDKDLLQISEEEYCKIRGSKISMIFQDPLSSLNPIKKVGIQITESMKLKRTSARKEAKADFRASEKLYNAFLASHPDFAVKKADLDDAIKMYQNPDDGYQVFALAKFDRISKDQIASFDKAIQATADEGKKTKLIQEEKAYKAKRDSKRVVLQSQLDEARKQIAESHTDYTQYDTSKLVALTRALFLEYDQGLLKRYQANGPALEKIAATFSSLDGAEYIKALKANLKEMDRLALDCANEVALEKDELIYTFPVQLKHLIKDYYSRVRAEAKQAKLEAKNAKKEKAGKSTDPTIKQRAWASEINTSSSTKIVKLKEVIAAFISAIKGSYISDLTSAMEPSAVETRAQEYVKKFTDNIVAFSHPVTNEQINEKAINLLGLVGIPEPQKRIKQYPFEFSGGMRQRIVIAIALSSNPEILICDEPTTALDVTIQAQILELINDLKKKLNLSIIFITHNLGVVANMADDIAVMYAGKIVEYGTVDEIFYQPRHPYTWALLASMPDLETKTKLDAIPGAPPNMIIPPKGDAFAARNKYAMKIDFEEQPPHFVVSPTHWAATWLLAKGAPHVEPPSIVTERIERMTHRNAGKE
jgi:oligopeptide/dipeptide ABC transporter ATP-binding protein